MTATWGRRARGPLSALLALALAPLLATSSTPTASVAHIEPSVDAEPLFVEEPFEDNLAYHTVTLATVFEPVHRPSRAADGGGAAVSPKGRLWTVSALSDHGLPVAAKKAYQRAAEQMSRRDPGCQLPWTLLAGIGRVESDHGRYGGARLGADGLSRPRIIGVQLDGKGPVAAIRDSDDGKLDRDKVWDRAVGPMQFIPSTWAFAARDGDGDGRKDVHDLDDAAAAAASYLCSGSGSLLDPGTQAAAVYRYNQDDYYVAVVQAFEVGYRTGVFVMPPPPPTEEELAERRRQRRAAKLAELREERRERRRAAAAAQEEQEAAAKTSAPAPAPKPSSSPSASPKPSPQPSPKPSPSKTAEPQPEPYDKTGKLATCDGGYCLGGALLDLGAVADFEENANDDYDLDGVVETNGNEVDGLLVMEQVTMTVVKMDSGRLGIISINGKSVG